MAIEDFTDEGVVYLYQQDAAVTSVSPPVGRDTSKTPLFVSGDHFVNSSQLECRVGPQRVKATYISSKLVLCFAPPRAAMVPIHGTLRGGGLRRPGMEHRPTARMTYQACTSFD